MKGLPGAATVIGSLVYGVGHCWRSNIQMHWRHGDLQHSDADAAALDKLRQASNEPNGKFPPLALLVFFLLYAAWVRSRAERPSVSYTKVVMEVAWTGHNMQCKKTN